MARVHHATRQRRRYSRDLRMRVIHQRFTLSRPTTQIAIDLDMPLRVVQRTIKNWKDIGDVVKEPQTMLRAPVLGPQQARLLLSLLEHSPDLYLDEIAEELEVLHGIRVSLSTVWRTLRKLGLRSKRLSKAAAERSEEKRREFTWEIGGEDPDSLVFIDESAVDLRTTYRMYGWAICGQRARISARFVRGKRFSVLPALTTQGIIYSHVRQGSYDGDAFLHYLEGLLEQMNPYPGPRSVLVLDNCAIHHVAEVEELCAVRGVKIIYLPPYSPDLNPIEECFAFVKSYIRRHGHRFRMCVETDAYETPAQFLYCALDQVTPQMAQGWFRHSRYL